MKYYNYVGPKEIEIKATHQPTGIVMSCRGDLMAWIESHAKDVDRAGCVWATFIVDQSGSLRLADRQSEHIACANRKRVLAAGEIAFTLSGDVEEVTNQSTGYCPRPECWEAVEAALSGLDVNRPCNFTLVFHFRRCPTCGQINVIKDNIYECAQCGQELPDDWNFDDNP